jgi:hypothetical protein
MPGRIASLAKPSNFEEGVLWGQGVGKIVFI